MAGCGRSLGIDFTLKLENKKLEDAKSNTGTREDVSPIREHKRFFLDINCCNKM
jgi:hypothetical protein